MHFEPDSKLQTRQDVDMNESQQPKDLVGMSENDALLYDPVADEEQAGLDNMLICAKCFEVVANNYEEQGENFTVHKNHATDLQID